MSDRITPDDIERVALRLLADGGLHALAMRRIAQELGVQQSALYWHVENKQRLLAAVADRVVAPVELADDPSVSSDWSARTIELARRLRAELRRYPDGAELVATAFAFRLGGDQPYRRFVEELRRGDVDDDAAEVAATVLVHFVFGFVTDEQQHDQAVALGAIDADGDTDDVDDDVRFGAGVAMIVAGLVARTGAADS